MKQKPKIAHQKPQRQQKDLKEQKPKLSMPESIMQDSNLSRIQDQQRKNSSGLSIVQSATVMSPLSIQKKQKMIMMNWENHKNKKLDDFYSEDYKKYSKLAQKEQEPTFNETLDEVTKMLDSTLNQCVHDYNLDEFRHLYDVINGDQTFQNSNSAERIAVSKKGNIEQKSRASLNQDIQISHRPQNIVNPKEDDLMPLQLMDQARSSRKGSPFGDVTVKGVLIQQQPSKEQLTVNCDQSLGMILQNPYIHDKASKISELIQSNEKLKNLSSRREKDSPSQSPQFRNPESQKFQYAEPIQEVESDQYSHMKGEIFQSNIKQVVRLKSLNMEQINDSPSNKESANYQITEEGKYTQQSLVGYLSSGTKRGNEPTMHLDMQSINQFSQKLDQKHIKLTQNNDDTNYDGSPVYKDSPSKKSIQASRFKFDDKISANSSAKGLQLALSADAIPDTQRKDNHDNMDDTLKINDLIKVTLPQADGVEGKSLKQVLIEKKEKVDKNPGFNPQIFKIERIRRINEDKTLTEESLRDTARTYFNSKRNNSVFSSQLPSFRAVTPFNNQQLARRRQQFGVIQFQEMMADDFGDYSQFEGLLNPNHPGRVPDVFSKRLTECENKKRDFSRKIDDAIANMMMLKNEISKEDTRITFTSGSPSFKREASISRSPGISRVKFDPKIDSSANPSKAELQQMAQSPAFKKQKIDVKNFKQRYNVPQSPQIHVSIMSNKDKSYSPHIHSSTIQEDQTQERLAEDSYAETENVLRSQRKANRKEPSPPGIKNTNFNLNGLQQDITQDDPTDGLTTLPAKSTPNVDVTSATQSNVNSPPNELVNMNTESVVPNLNVPIVNALALNKQDWRKLQQLQQPTLDTIMRECEPGEDPTFRNKSPTSRMHHSPAPPQSSSRMGTDTFRDLGQMTYNQFVAQQVEGLDCDDKRRAIFMQHNAQQDNQFRASQQNQKIKVLNERQSPQTENKSQGPQAITGINGTSIHADSIISSQLDDDFIFFGGDKNLLPTQQQLFQKHLMQVKKREIENKQNEINEIQQKLDKMNEYRFGKIHKNEEIKSNFDIEEFLKDLRKHSRDNNQLSRASKMDVTIPSTHAVRRGASKQGKSGSNKQSPKQAVQKISPIDIMSTKHSQRRSNNASPDISARAQSRQESRLIERIGLNQDLTINPDPRDNEKLMKLVKKTPYKERKFQKPNMLYFKPVTKNASRLNQKNLESQNSPRKQKDQVLKTLSDESNQEHVALNSFIQKSNRYKDPLNQQVMANNFAKTQQRSQTTARMGRRQRVGQTTNTIWSRNNAKLMSDTFSNGTRETSEFQMGLTSQIVIKSRFHNQRRTIDQALETKKAVVKSIKTKPNSNLDIEEEQNLATKGQSNEEMQNALTPITPESPKINTVAPSPMPEHVIIAVGESNESLSMHNSMKDQLDKEIQNTFHSNNDPNHSNADIISQSFHKSIKSPKAIKQLGTFYLPDEQPLDNKSNDGIKPFDGSKMTLAIQSPSHLNQSQITTAYLNQQGIISTGQIFKENSYIEKPMSLGNRFTDDQNYFDKGHTSGQTPSKTLGTNNFEGMTKNNGIIQQQNQLQGNLIQNFRRQRNAKQQLLGMSKEKGDSTHQSMVKIVGTSQRPKTQERDRFSTVQGRLRGSLGSRKDARYRVKDHLIQNSYKSEIEKQESMISPERKAQLDKLAELYIKQLRRLEQQKQILKQQIFNQEGENGYEKYIPNISIKVNQKQQLNQSSFHSRPYTQGQNMKFRTLAINSDLDISPRNEFTQTLNHKGTIPQVSQNKNVKHQMKMMVSNPREFTPINIKRPTNTQENQSKFKTTGAQTAGNTYRKNQQNLPAILSTQECIQPSLVLFNKNMVYPMPKSKNNHHVELPHQIAAEPETQGLSPKGSKDETFNDDIQTIESKNLK